MVAKRYVLVNNLTLSMGPEEFVTRQDDFAAALSSSMKRVCASQSVEDTKGETEGVGKGGGGAGHACQAAQPGDVEVVGFSAGSVIVNFRIWVRPPHGPPTPVVRRFFLDWWPRLLESLGEGGFPSPEGASQPTTTTVIIGALSADALAARLFSETFAGAANLFFALDGVWGAVLLWSITTRGAKCREASKRSFLSLILPSSQTIQVLILAIFVQLVCSNVFHKYLDTSTVFDIAAVALGVGAAGSVFVFLLNSWIRGTTFSLKGLDQIDVHGPTLASEGEQEEAERDYARYYEAGQKGQRALGQLAQHDWKGSHMQWEKAQGLVDFSDTIFEHDIEPEHDIGLVAQFLNSSLLSAFGNKRAAPAEPRSPRRAGAACPAHGRSRQVRGPTRVQRPRFGGRIQYTLYIYIYV